MKKSLKGISFYYTQRCTISCRHCYTVSSPETDRKTDPVIAERVLADAMEVGCWLVSFTGGEPMIFEDEILTLARKAAVAGMKVLIMTNGFWANTPESAGAVAAGLSRAGVTHVCVSTDGYHRAAGIPYDSVIRAVVALRQHGISVKVHYVRDRVDESLDRFMELSEPLSLIVETSSLAPFGRASTLDRMRFAAADDPAEGRCTVMPVVMPNGDVVKCCGGTLASEPAPRGHPLLLGNVNGERYRNIIQRVLHMEDVLLAAFIAWGPKRLGMLLGENFWRDEERPPYYGICDTCCRLLNDPGRIERLRCLVALPQTRRRIERTIAITDGIDDVDEERWNRYWDYDSWRRDGQVRGG